MQTKYSQRFYKNRKNPSSSAEIISEIVFDLVRPRKVLDLGCGNGEFLNFFKKRGAKEILGVDGNWIKKENLEIPQECFLAADLEKPFKSKKQYDLAVSLEVAKHLGSERAESFVEDLVDLAPVVLFSAAIPYQGGTGHKNEQWLEYWAEFF